MNQTGEQAPPIHFQAGEFSWLIAPQFDSPLLRTWLGEIESLPRDTGAFLRRPGQTAGSEVFRFELPGLATPQLIVKRYGEFRLAQIIKRLFRGSRGRRAFLWASRLRRLGISALEPVAAGTWGWRPWRSYFISVEIVSAETLLEVVQANAKTLDRRLWLRVLAQILAKLHDHGISYGDAHLTNFIVEHAGTANQRLVLSDLDGLRHFHWITTRRAARDLRRLRPYTPATPAEQIRFVAEYSRCRERHVCPREILAHLEEGRRAQIV